MVASIALKLRIGGSVVLHYTTLNVDLSNISCLSATMTMLDLDYKQSVLELKKQKNAVVLAHNYQLPEVQDIADFIGDSLALSKQATLAQSDIIFFCRPLHGRNSFNSTE